jgi:hypothetical protein
MMHNEQMVGPCGVPTAAAPWQCGVLSSIRATFPANSPSLSLGIPAPSPLFFDFAHDDPQYIMQAIFYGYMDYNR